MQNPNRARRSGFRSRRRTWRWLLLLGAAAIMLALVVAILSRDRAPVRASAATATAATVDPPLDAQPVARLQAFGDSITAGYGLVEGEAWPYALASRLGVVFTNANLHAVLGGAVIDWGEQAYQAQARAGDLSVILPGYNDVRANGTDPDRLRRYTGALEAYVAWLAIPATAKWTASAIPYRGAWQAVAEFGQATSARGASARVTVRGRAVYVATWIDPAGGMLDVLVDGRRVARVSTRGAMGNGGAVSKTRRGPMLIRVPGLRDGAHEVEVVAAGDGPVALTWIGGSGGLGDVPPRVLVGEPLAMSAKGAGDPSDPYGHYSDAARAAYAAASQRLAAALRSDGLQVTHVAADAHYDPAAQTQADNVHPDLEGRTTIAEAFIAALPPELVRSYDPTAGLEVSNSH